MTKTEAEASLPAHSNLIFLYPVNLSVPQTMRIFQTGFSWLPLISGAPT